MLAGVLTSAPSVSRLEQLRSMSSEVFACRAPEQIASVWGSRDCTHNGSQCIWPQGTAAKDTPVVTDTCLRVQ